MPALKIAISGISGRMGQILVQAALEDRSVQLAGALARAGSEWTGRDAGARFGQTTGVAVSEDIEAGLVKVEYLIDFTSAEYTLACLPVARRQTSERVFSRGEIDQILNLHQPRLNILRDRDPGCLTKTRAGVSPRPFASSARQRAGQLYAAIFQSCLDQYLAHSAGNA